MSDNATQETIFNVDPQWIDEWVDMPEFVQDRKKEFSKIIVRFDTKEDLDDFARLIGQRLTTETKSIWHPYKSHWRKDRGA